MKKIYTIEFRDTNSVWGACYTQEFFCFKKKKDAHEYLISKGYKPNPYLSKDQYILKDGFRNIALYYSEYAYIRALEVK